MLNSLTAIKESVSLSKMEATKMVTPWFTTILGKQIVLLERR